MSDTFPLGSVVPLTFNVYDEDGELEAPDTVTLTITLPDGSTTTPTPDNPDDGEYEYDYTPASVGRYVAVFVATGTEASGTVVFVFDIVATDLSIVTLEQVKAYLGDTSDSDEQIEQALDAERASQAARCDVSTFNYDLREALMRRVARNLAARAVPVATFTSFEGGGTSARVPQVDAEIRRLESPYLALTVG